MSTLTAANDLCDIRTTKIEGAGYYTEITSKEGTTSSTLPRRLGNMMASIEALNTEKSSGGGMVSITGVSITIKSRTV